MNKFMNKFPNRSPKKSAVKLLKAALSLSVSAAIALGTALNALADEWDGYESDDLVVELTDDGFLPELTDGYEAPPAGELTGEAAELLSEVIKNGLSDPLTADLLADYKTIDSGFCGAKGNEQGVSWALNEIGVLTISGSGDMGFNDEAAPWYVYSDNILAVVFAGGSRVTSVADMAFYSLHKITKVILPNSVKRIGSAAFAGCDLLTSVTMPAGLEYLGDLAFYYCLALTDITIPDGVTAISDYTFAFCSELQNVTISKNLVSIGDGAFGNCRKLAAIELPETLQSIGNEAFGVCVSLTGVTLPGGLTRLGRFAFGGCSGLRSFKIPKAVTEIGENPVTGCHKLSSISVDKENENYCSIGGVVYSSDMTKLVAYPPAKLGTNYIIPDTIKIIGDHAFLGNRYIRNLVIPASVEIIGESAFEDSKSLVSVVIPYTVTTIGISAFENAPYIGENEVRKVFLTITGCIGSAAYDYAVKNDLLFNPIIDFIAAGSDNFESLGMVYDYMAGTGELDNTQQTIADINQDGYIDIRDYNLSYSNINK